MGVSLSTRILRIEVGQKNFVRSMPARALRAGAPNSAMANSDAPLRATRMPPF
jgi:hypothetical protein